MTEYKAIETIYNGYRFRSRLEARWAVFFDTAGIRYEYEPEGFEIEYSDWDQPIRYLPDFYFPDWDIYGEVKPSLEKLKEDEEKLAWMIDYGGPMSNGLLVLGQIPNPNRNGIPALYLLINRNKSIARVPCTILNEEPLWTEGKPTACLLRADYDADNASAPELPLSGLLWGHTAASHPLFESTVCIPKRMEVPGLRRPLYMRITFAQVGEMIPFDAYTKARQARFEYGETPKVTEGI